ncbi:unnamed protein product [Aphanomyces euteiches]
MDERSAEFFIVRSGLKQITTSPNDREAWKHEEKTRSEPPVDTQPSRSGSNNIKEYVATHLNRCGSTPQLPLQSAPGSYAFSSSKKRLLPSKLNLTPISKKGQTPPAPTSSNLPQSDMFHHLSVEKIKHEYERLLASNRVRQNELEREVTDLHKALQKERKLHELAQLENQSLRDQVAQLYLQLDDERKITLQQKKAFAKVSQRFVAANETLHKLSSAADGTDGVKSVLQAMSKENQDFQRRIKVLETQHKEDKKSLTNSEKKLKTIKMELESIEHMQMAKAPSGDNGGSEPTSNDSTVPQTIPINENDPHSAISAILEQYIDPNLLRILHKVDSQFSISNAINLSSTMKRWLHSCQSINISLDSGQVLEDLMQKICNVLQCEHSAVFTQSVSARKLTCRCTNTGQSQIEVPFDKGIVSHVLKTGTPCNIPCAYDDAHFYSPQDNLSGFTTRDVICVPIFDHKREAIGALRACNSGHGKGFSSNDLIVLGLFAIQTGIILQEFEMESLLKVSQTKLLRLHEMPRTLASESVPNVEQVSLIRFVLAAERHFHQILGVTKIKLFLIDGEVENGGMIWCVGKTLDSNCDTTYFRQYYKLSSGLCGLAIYHPKGLTITDPLTHAKYNGAIDLSNPTTGMYLVPIMSLWGKPLGILQVGRSVTNAKGPKVEMLERQQAEDTLKLHMISLFANSMACILHELHAHDLLVKCPEEVKQARMGTLKEQLEKSQAESKHRLSNVAINEDQMKQFMAANTKVQQIAKDTTYKSAVSSNNKHAESHRRATTTAALNLPHFPPHVSHQKQESATVLKPSIDDIKPSSSSGPPPLSSDCISPTTSFPTIEEYSTSRPSTPRTPSNHIECETSLDYRSDAHEVTPSTIEEHLASIEMTPGSERQNIVPHDDGVIASETTSMLEEHLASIEMTPASEKESVVPHDDGIATAETANLMLEELTQSRLASFEVVDQPTTEKIETPLLEQVDSAPDIRPPENEADPSVFQATNKTEVPLISQQHQNDEIDEPNDTTTTAQETSEDVSLLPDITEVIAPLNLTVGSENPEVMESSPSYEVHISPTELESTSESHEAPEPSLWDSPAASQGMDHLSNEAQFHVDPNGWTEPTHENPVDEPYEINCSDEQTHHYPNDANPEWNAQYIDDPTLPPGWTAIAHGEHIYYENHETGEQTWTHPASQ